jgi:RHS repeat-associated protein
VTYDYINDEHLKQVTSNAGTYILAYDALGRCVKRTLNGLTTYYIYDGEKPILEYRSGNLNNPAKNVYGKGIDEILMRYDPTLTQNQTFYYQQDHEGSVTHLIDTSGNLIETYRYDAFGAPAIYDVANPPHRLSSSSCSNRFLFTGREYANLFGFYEYRARAYHPGLGRFMSEDPKLFDAGDYNLFRYCHNDPIDNLDPMGLQDTVATYSPRETSQLKEAVQEALRQAAQQRAYAHAYSRGNFEGGTSFIGTANYTMGHINQSSRSMYTYSLKSQYSMRTLGGADGQYIYVSDPKYDGECLTAVQHTTGAPSTSTPLIRGVPVGPSTPPGTAIATNWIKDSGTGLWIYPSKLHDPLQHAAILAKNLGGGQMQVLHQYHGTPLHFSHVIPTANWFTVTGNVPPSAASTSEIRPWIGSIQQPMY